MYGEHTSSGNYGSLGGSNYGVYGITAEGAGVKGRCTTAIGIGVHGIGTQKGVVGYSTYGVGVEGNSRDGIAVSAEGDLYVSGAYRGDISSSSGDDGAPFPPPAYDSGWISIELDEEKTLRHNIGGTVDNYVVDMQCKDVDASWGISNYGVGGDLRSSFSGVGAYYHKLTTQSITVGRQDEAYVPDRIRIRIWVYW